MRVLVLDGNENQSVACVRSLAAAGHSVTVAASTSWSKAGWSRFCRGTHVYPAPEQGADAFVADIAREAQRAPGTLILPLTERTTLPLSGARDQILAAGGRLVLPAHETVLRAFDKGQTTRLAESIGIAVPRTAVIDDGAPPARIAHSLRYPVVLKPRMSVAANAGRLRATGAPAYAGNPEQLAEAYRRIRERSPSVLVQEFVAGTGAGYFALMCHGALRAEFAHRRIRDVRPSGSGSALRVSVAPDDRLRKAGLAILEALGWHGVAMVEFRIGADGTPVFLEVNGRFWNSLALAVFAGVDFPALLARMAEQGDADGPAGYREGVRCRWLLGDFRHLVEVWRGAPPGYPGKFPGRLRTLLDVLAPVPGTYHDNFTLEDPWPEVGDWLDFAFRRVPAMMGRGVRSNTP